MVGRSTTSGTCPSCSARRGHSTTCDGHGGDAYDHDCDWRTPKCPEGYYECGDCCDRDVDCGCDDHCDWGSNADCSLEYDGDAKPAGWCPVGYHDCGHHDCCDWNSDCACDGAWRTGNDDEHCGVGPTGHDGALPDFECSVRKGDDDTGGWNKRGGFLNYGLNAGGCFSCSITDDEDRLMETCATLCAGDDACKSFEIKPTSGECCIEHVDSSDADYPNYWIDASAIVANCPDHILSLIHI